MTFLAPQHGQVTVASVATMPSYSQESASCECRYYLAVAFVRPYAQSAMIAIKITLLGRFSTTACRGAHDARLGNGAGVAATMRSSWRSWNAVLFAVGSQHRLPASAMNVAESWRPLRATRRMPRTRVCSTGCGGRRSASRRSWPRFASWRPTDPSPQRSHARGRQFALRGRRLQRN